MITGAHTILFTKDADRDRAFFRDVLGFPFVDAGHGWLIFGLPPSEVACHPADGETSHELYLMCDDVKALVRDMAKKGVETTPLHEERWGILTQITLPSGAKLGVYEPKHPTAAGASGGGAKKRAAAKRPAKKGAAKGAKAAKRAKKRPAK